MMDLDLQGCLRLRDAIVKQACEDYRVALKYNNPSLILVCEHFFRSKYFTDLVRGKIEGEYLIEKINKEVPYGTRKNFENEVK